MPKKALGRGLEALLPKINQKEKKNIEEIPLDNIVANPQQPRKVFDQDLLEDLAQSIQTAGLLQPVVVTRTDDHYTIIVGERRVRACRLAGLETIPALVKTEEEINYLHLALIENLQREDLNPIDQALAFDEYMREFDVTQEQLANLLKKDRSVIANIVRLLKLPEPVQIKIRDGLLSAGHARGLLSLKNADEQIRLSEKIIEEAWSVRTTEQYFQNKKKRKRKKVKPTPEATQDVNVTALRDQLVRFLATNVSISSDKKGGQLVISFYDDDDLTRLANLIMNL